MSPTISAGSLVVVQDEPASDVEVGDVVAVGSGHGGRVMHRVVTVTPAGDGSGRTVLTLQGDANATPDKEPYVVDSVGSVRAHVSGLGYPVAWLGTPLGRLGLGALACGLVVFGLRPARPVGGRRRALAAVAVPVAAATVVGTSPPAHAWFDDSGTVTSSAATAGNLLPPTNVQCSGAGLLQTPTISWTAPTGSATFSRYRLVYRQGSANAAETEVFVTGTSWQAPAAFLNLLTTYYITVQTATGAGTNWTSKNYATPGITVSVTGVIGLSALTTCGTYAVSQPAW
jgi:signal peptidase I